jgi:hypothetical protein
LSVFSCSRKKRIKLLATIALAAHEYPVVVILKLKLARLFRRLHILGPNYKAGKELRVGRAMKSVLDKLCHRLGTTWGVEVLFQLGK